MINQFLKSLCILNSYDIEKWQELCDAHPITDKKLESIKVAPDKLLPVTVSLVHYFEAIFDGVVDHCLVAASTSRHSNWLLNKLLYSFRFGEPLSWAIRASLCKSDVVEL